MKRLLLLLTTLAVVMLAANAPGVTDEMLATWRTPDYVRSKPAGHVRLAVYNVHGQLVRVLVDGEQATGTQSAVWNGTDEQGRAVSSGVYLYRLEASGRSLTKRMVLVR